MSRRLSQRDRDRAREPLTSRHAAEVDKRARGWDRNRESGTVVRLSAARDNPAVLCEHYGALLGHLRGLIRQVQASRSGSAVKALRSVAPGKVSLTLGCTGTVTMWRPREAQSHGTPAARHREGPVVSLIDHGYCKP